MFTHEIHAGSYIVSFSCIAGRICGGPMVWDFWIFEAPHAWCFPALEFDPDRFLDARLQKYLTPNPFIFLPFNAGPRICPGQQVSIFADMLRDWLSQSKVCIQWDVIFPCSVASELLVDITRFEGANPPTDGMGQWTWTEECRQGYFQDAPHNICSGESLWYQPINILAHMSLGWLVGDNARSGDSLTCIRSNIPQHTLYV